MLKKRNFAAGTKVVGTRVGYKGDGHKEGTRSKLLRAAATHEAGELFPTPVSPANPLASEARQYLSTTHAAGGHEGLFYQSVHACPNLKLEC